MSLQEKFQKLCGQHIRITLQDDRRVYGVLSCFDYQKNFVLQDSVEEIPEKYVTQVNENLLTHIRKDNWFLKQNPQIQQQIKEQQNNGDELAEQLNQQWMKNKFVIGQVIIPGKQVKKIEQVKGYIPIKNENKQEIQSKQQQQNSEQKQQEQKQN